MGIAAYNRGTAVLRREFDNKELDRHLIEVLNRINAMRKGTAKPFSEVVIQMPDGKGPNGTYWWLMRAGEDRHSHYAFCYKSLQELMAEWSLNVVGVGGDKHGKYYTTEIS